MKKVFSYFIYFYAVLGPVPLTLILYSINHGEILSTELIGPNILFGSVAGYFLYSLFKYKRIYYDANNIYVYGLFSTKQPIIYKKDIINIYQMFKIDPLNYKIAFHDKNGKTKIIYLFKDILLLNKVNPVDFLSI